MKKMSVMWVKANVRLDKLQVDHSYQGQLQKRRVAELFQTWDDSLGYVGIAVSQRKDGSYWILDGQHRVAALLEAGYGEYDIEVNLYRDLGLADEARLFHLLQKQRSHSLYERYNSAVLGKMHPESEIDDVLQKCGWQASNFEGKGRLCAIGCVKTVWSRYGADVLRVTLTVIGDAWKREDGSAAAQIISGVARAYANNKEMDTARLAKKLGLFDGGHRKLVQQIRGIVDLRRCSMGEAGEEAVLAIMRRGTRRP